MYLSGSGAMASSVRLFFFVLVIKFPGSTGEADAALKVLKARI